MGNCGWIIDRDYLWKKGDNSKKRTGVKSAGWDFAVIGLRDELVRFRCKDDDGAIYYGGWLIDDEYCNSQEMALAFCMVDAGCTTIEVKRAGEWIQEIG